MITALSDYYRVPEGFLNSLEPGKPQGDPGFFHFGPETVCYGQCSSGVAKNVQNSELHDARKSVRTEGAVTHLAFDPNEVIQNLRRERYEARLIPGRERLVTHEWVRKAYYSVRDVLPDSLRRSLQRAYFSDWKSRPFPSWPVDFTVDNLHQELLRLSMERSGLQSIPFVWFWPHGAPGGLILTHDVETRTGRDFTSQLMNLDSQFGLRASFQVIPEQRYEITQEYINEIRTRGFEFNIHDLNHDGRLYRQRDEFLRRAMQINCYARRYDSRGFRAGAMYRNQDWYDAYEFSYDMSVPNVAHFEPRRGGCCTVFPYFVGSILELPLTICQDYTLFHIFRDYSIDVWKQQIAMIEERNGLISVLAHPDYLIGSRERAVYSSFLEHLHSLIEKNRLWMALPGEVDRWWRARSQMKVERRNSGWEIQGPESEKARIAFARLEGGRLRFQLAEATALNGSVDDSRFTGAPTGKLVG